MAQSYQQLYRRAFQDFSGGLNDLLSPLTVQANQFTDLENAVINDRGLLEKAKGYITDGSPFPNDVDSFVRMMVNYKRGTSVDNLVVAALDDGNTNATYKVDLKSTSGDGTYAYIGHTSGTDASFTNGNTAVTGVGTTWTTHLKAGDKIKATAHADSVYAEILTVNSATSITLTANYTGATVTNVAYIARIILHKDFIPQGITFNNNLVVTNGSDTPMSYNNTTLTLITDAQAPKGKFITAHKGRVFIASTSGAPSSLFWSAANDETAWDAASLEPIFPQDGGNIAGIKSFGDSLIVLKDNGGVYQVVGSFDQDSVGYIDFVRRLDGPENIGTIAGRTAVVCDDGKLRFLARTGWYEIDGRMVISKISWNVDNLAASVVIQPGPSQSKSYLFDTKTQWDTGTHSGTKATTNGELENYFDTFTITDAKKSNDLVASFIDSSNVVHVAYVKEATPNAISYKQYSIAGAVTEETAVTETITTTEVVKALSIAVSANGKIGVGYIYGVAGSNNSLKFVQRVSGTWQSAVTVASASQYVSVDVKYRTDNDCRMVWILSSGGTADYGYAKQTGTAWGAATTIGTGFSSDSNRISLTLATNLPHIMFCTPGGSEVKYNTSVGDFTTWALETISVTSGDSWTRPKVVLNSTSQAIAMWGDTTVVKVRNIATATTSTLDSTTSKALGHALNSSNAEHWVRVSSAGNETIAYSSSLVANPTSATIDTAYIVGASTFEKDGVVFAYACFGTNANEIIIRRFAPTSIYTAAEQSDSTLTAWGTYDVASEVAAGNTVLHEIAVATASPASSYATITNGSIVSSDAAKIFVIARITITLVAWARSSIGSVTINYVGAGVDARQPVSVLFENEYYTAITESGQANNNIIVIYDKADAFSTVTPDVSCFCVYKNLLYAGLATRGNVIKLQTGYNHASSSYTLTAVTKEDLLGSIELQKKVEKLYVIYEVQAAGTFDFSYRLDNFTSATPATWTTSTIDQTATGISEVSIHSPLCRSIQFKVEQDELDGRLAIIGFVVTYSYVGLR